MKVVGIGLNKTGTKTLRAYLKHLGLKHATLDHHVFYLMLADRMDEVMDVVDQFDSFEDWPWPLLYKEIDARYPESRFILTTRSSSQVWFESLCRHAVKVGPLERIEEFVYGYAMPQGHREELIRFYEDHNRAVQEYFKERPSRLLKICWEDGDTVDTIAEFLGRSADDIPPRHENRGKRWLYSGNNILIAQTNRVIYQTGFKNWRRAKRLGVRLRDRLIGDEQED